MELRSNYVAAMDARIKHRKEECAGDMGLMQNNVATMNARTKLSMEEFV